MTTAHAAIASPADVVHCDRLRCTLTAGACAARHVARDHGGHRNQRHQTEDQQHPHHGGVHRRQRQPPQQHPRRGRPRAGAAHRSTSSTNRAVSRSRAAG